MCDLYKLPPHEIRSLLLFVCFEKRSPLYNQSDTIFRNLLQIYLILQIFYDVDMFGKENYNKN